MIKHIEYRGARYRYLHSRLKGNDPTIVYVGGAFQSIESVINCEAWLSQFNHLIIELPGFGESTPGPQPNSFDFFAECIDRAVEECALRDFFAYAYSYGVGPMGRYVSRHEDKVKGFIVAGGLPFLTEQMEKSVERLIATTHCKRTFLEVFMSTFFFQDEAVLSSGRLSHSLVKRKIRGVSQDELDRFAENYQVLLHEHRVVTKVSAQVPVVVIGGELDTFVDKSLLSEFKKYCGKVTIFQVSNADHFFYLQRPDLLLYLVKQFMAEHSDSLPANFAADLESV